MQNLLRIDLNFEKKNLKPNKWYQNFVFDKLKLQIMCFQNFWNHSHALHVMKNLFKIVYAEKLLVFSKILSFDWSNVFFDQLKILFFQNMIFNLARLMFDWFSINRIWFLKLSIDRIWFSINRKFPDFSSLGSASLDWYLIDSQPIKIEKFSVIKYLTNHFSCIIYV